MSEDRIKRAVDFLRNNKIENVNQDEKISYLKSKMTEEELSEALNRMNKKNEQKEEAKVINTTSNQLAQPSYTAPSIGGGSYPPSTGGGYHPPPPRSSARGSSLMNAVNIGAISAVSSIGISYLINNIKDKKEKMVFECMKDFQEQSVNSLQTKINELQEENAMLKSKMLTEADVKMIISKAMDNRMVKSDHDEDFQRRNSQSLNEPISLQIKGAKGRFLGSANKNNNLRQSVTGSNDSDDKKEPTTELCESMNKFLRHAQENNSEVMREMKTMNKNMSSCFTTLSLALNKLSSKLGSSEDEKPKDLPNLPPVNTGAAGSGFLTKTQNLATSSHIKSRQEEIKKDETKIESLNKFLNGDQEDSKKETVTPDGDKKEDEGQEEEKKDVNDPQDSNPKIEEETSLKSPIDDVLKIGASVNSPPEPSSEEQKSNTLSQVEPSLTAFIESLSDLSPEDKKHCISRLCSLFSTMLNNQAKGQFKIMLSNKMFAKIVENKKDEFIQLITGLSFVEKSKDLYEAGDPEVMRSVLNDTELIKLLRQHAS